MTMKEDEIEFLEKFENMRENDHNYPIYFFAFCVGVCCVFVCLLCLLKKLCPRRNIQAIKPLRN